MVGKSERGYITYETLYKYLCNGFNDWMNETNATHPVIVWTDWHETRNNYYLAKQLNEFNIILYGLQPNATHFMQPLDVVVFGPLKKAWTRAAKEWEREHHDEILNQQHFAEVFLPTYHHYLPSKNIKAGFAKCGLLLFDPDKTDYSKIEAVAAQQECPATVFEGVDQGGCKEVSCQTVPPLFLNRDTQTSTILQVTTTHERKTKFKFTGSMCDLVTEYNRVQPTPRCICFTSLHAPLNK